MGSEDEPLLPVIEWGGQEFLVDVANRQFRNVNDADDFIGMHSSQGRAMLRQMQNTQWHVFAVDSNGQREGMV